eukprot:1959584-Prymnesium_polylepis.1
MQRRLRSESCRDFGWGLIGIPAVKGRDGVEEANQAKNSLQPALPRNDLESSVCEGPLHTFGKSHDGPIQFDRAEHRVQFDDRAVQGVLHRNC